jgi:hypothetical protein
MNASVLVRLAPALAVAVLTAPASFLAVPAAAAERPGLHEVARFDLAGSGEAGALQSDASAKRLYVARGDQIDVLNSDTGAKLGAIAPVPGVRALVLAPDLKRGFAVGSGTAITVFDLDSMSVVKTVASPGQVPVAVAYDPEMGHLFVANEQSGDLAVLDARSGEVAADLPLGGKLGGIVCDGFARVFVTAADLNAIHVVDSHTLKSLGDYPTAPGVGPLGIAIENSGRRLFVPCGNGKLVVVDGDIGATFRILKLEGGGPACVAFGLADADAPVGDPPWKGRIVTAMGDGTLNVGRMIAFVNFISHDHLLLGAKPLGVAIDGDTQRTFVLTAPSATASQVIVLEP